LTGNPLQIKCAIHKFTESERTPDFLACKLLTNAVEVEGFDLAPRRRLWVLRKNGAKKRLGRQSVPLTQQDMIGFSTSLTQKVQ